MKDVTQSSQDWEDFWYNSPINSPYIAMTKQLTDVQIDQLIEQYVEIVVDNMDTKTMAQIVTDQLESFYDDSHLDFIKDEVESYQEGLFEELVDNVTHQTTEAK